MKKRSSKVLSLFLTLVMICSFTLSGVGPVVTYAEDTSPFEPMYFYYMYADDETSELTVSENATAKLYEKKVYTIGPWKAHKAQPYMDYGLLLKAEQDELSEVKEGEPSPAPTATATITFNDMIDFGTDTLSRIELNGLAKRGSNAKAEIYIDAEDTTPVATIPLSNQTQLDDWRRSKNYSVAVTEKITGSHKVIIKIQNAGKSLEALVRSIQFVQESIPVMNITIDESKGSIQAMNSDMTHGTDCYGTFTLQVPDGYKAETDPEGTFVADDEYEMEYIRGRGNSTWEVNKKPYKIKLEKGANFFNMGKSKHWALIANYFDNSLVRNRMTYRLGKELGYLYTPDCVSIDVVMNGEYLGNYLLCENVRVEKDRVDITDLEEVYDKAEDGEEIDISGGYLISNSPYGGELGYGFETPHGHSFYLNNPESEYETTLYKRTGIGDDGLYEEEQQEDEEIEEWEDTSPYAAANAYITNYVNELEDAIYADDYVQVDSDSYNKVADMMDIDSAVRYYWMQEVSNNGDGFVSPSTYLYKEADQEKDGEVINGKLYWGPLWDFDFVAWGANDYAYYDKPNKKLEEFAKQEVWFARLMENPTFAKKVKDYWKDVLYPALTDAIANGGMLDQYKEELQVSAVNNFRKWGYTQFFYYVEYPIENLEEIQDYPFEINRLKDWISHRCAWINKHLNEIAPMDVEVIFKNGDEIVYQTTGTAKSSFIDFPEENPTKDNEIFIGWEYAKTSDVDEEWEVDRWFANGDVIQASKLNEKDQLILNAVFVPKEDIVEVENLFFEKKDYYMLCSTEGVMQGITLKYKILPEEASYSDLHWSSSNPDIATVNDGCIISNAVGDTVITATTTTGKSFSTNVHVISFTDYYESDDDYSLESFKLEKTELALTVGKGEKLYAVLEPEKVLTFEGEEDQVNNIVWMSMDESVVTVDDIGYVTAVGVGTTSIMAYNQFTRTVRTCKVTVSDGKPTDKPSNPNGSNDSGNKGDTTTKPGAGNATGTGTTTTEVAKDLVKVGTTFTAGNLNYKVTACKDKDLQVEVTGAKESKATVLIPATVKYEDKTYKVTTIGKSAFANDKKLKTVQIGKNITEIKSKAFAKCKKLKTIKVSSKVLKKVSKDAFQKIAKEASVKVPKAKKKAYKKLFKGLKVK